ncbi:MAG: CAP domain-containing protein [Verrucomicrobiota bacterium]
MDTRAEEVPRNAIRIVHQAPPGAPPTAINEGSPRSAKGIFLSTTPTLYSIGDPIDEEQLYLEFINRARANPPVEGQRLINTTDPDVVGAYNFFQVDLLLVGSQFAAIGAAPPLSMNEKLLTAARLHTQDMFENQFQDHQGTKGCPVGKVPCDNFDRVTAQSYPWTVTAENVFAHAKSVFYGHAGLNVDWGGTSGNGGIQNPPGHRLNIHNSTFREVGIGVGVGSNGSVGPQLVTQDFGSRGGLTPIVTGVAYYDFNGNGFYDLGEGIGGVKVTIPGSAFYALTANSGGYSVPVPGNGNYAVTFGGPELADTQMAASVTANNNFKVDFVPAYSAPIISGPDPAAVNQDNTYHFTFVGGAVAYQWKQERRIPFTATEGAENGPANVTAEVSPDYQLITNDAKASGNFSFRLAHLDTPTDQSVTLNRFLRPGADSELIFFTRLGWATSNQVARAQISSDGGKSWRDVWSQAGTGDQGETSFHRQDVSLAAHAASEIKVRFIYQYLGDVYFNNAAPGVGFYLDDISVTGAEELVDALVTDVTSGSSFNFSPTAAGDYSLRVRARVLNRFLDYGPARLVTATIGTPPALSMEITGTEITSGNKIQIDFDLLSGSPGTFHLEGAPTPAGPWVVESGASINRLPLPGKFRAISSIAGVRERYFRVSAN